MTEGESVATRKLTGERKRLSPAHLDVRCASSTADFTSCLDLFFREGGIELGMAHVMTSKT